MQCRVTCTKPTIATSYFAPLLRASALAFAAAMSAALSALDFSAAAAATAAAVLLSTTSSLLTAARSLSVR
eukprot:10243-Heterococcus_DN1.PRE.1